MSDPSSTTTSLSPRDKDEELPPSSVKDSKEEEDEFSLSLEGKKKKKKSKKVKNISEEETSIDGNSANALVLSAHGEEGAEKEGERDHRVVEEEETRDYTYTELLDRVFHLLHEKNPNLASRKRYSMPPPQLVRVGTRKTMWANFAQNCAVMHRQPEHTMSFLLAELGTEGSIDGNQRFIIKGRYLPKQIESVLKKYIHEYVTCHMCRNPETTLTRDSVTRLYFIQCESCGSRRSVAPIKSGFHATMRAERRKAAQEG